MFDAYRGMHLLNILILSLSLSRCALLSLTLSYHHHYILNGSYAEVLCIYGLTFLWFFSLFIFFFFCCCCCCSYFFIVCCLKIFDPFLLTNFTWCKPASHHHHHCNSGEFLFYQKHIFVAYVCVCIRWSFNLKHMYVHTSYMYVGTYVWIVFKKPFADVNKIIFDSIFFCICFSIFPLHFPLMAGTAWHS